MATNVKSSEYVLPLADPGATLEQVGGKGASLARLVRAGLPVPDGFHVTTAAYQRFVAENELQPAIRAALEQVDVAQPTTLEAASGAIGALFAAAQTPAEVASAIQQAYAEMAGRNPVVAVRSSATAEDLPEASFAGQQETFLNVEGSSTLLEAVKRCWASLWTARAIGYRARQRIGVEGLGLAVVVQQMVAAEAAGILFTANPLNGRRDQAVISAAWGLGEAVVGGLVTPDALTVEKATGHVLERQTADKQFMTMRVPGGTEERPVPAELRQAPVLSDDQAAELVRLGVQIEELYGVPMDIEWALADETFAILQARPITALPEPKAPAIIEWKLPHPKGQYIRGSIADLMPNPVSPLFATLALPALARLGIGEVLRLLTRSEPELPDYIVTINNYVYVGVAFNPREWWWIFRRLLLSFPRIVREALPLWRDEIRPRYAATVARWQDKPLEAMPTAELWAALQQVNDAAMLHLASLLVATTGASAGAEALFTRVYEKLVQRPGDPKAVTFLMGYDSTPIQCDKSLYDIAIWSKQQDDLTSYLSATPTELLVEQLALEQPPVAGWGAFRERFQDHQQRYGHIIYDLDFASPLPLDDPRPMLATLKMYLRGEGVSPLERQRTAEAQRLQATDATLKRLSGIRRWAFRKTVNMAQTMAKVRENALSDIGLGYPLLRKMLLELGRRFAQAGFIARGEDIFWLQVDEVQEAIAGLERGQLPTGLHATVSQRKATHEALKRITPPPTLPPRKRYLCFDMGFWAPAAEEAHTGSTLKGVAASAGLVTAPARVLSDPRDFNQMRQGEVLVAGTTTPAWTPLFAMASAVVTDIGGPLSHGSIVAREYGIPAVMGTGVASRRIRSGQHLRVDGTRGVVTILDGDKEGEAPDGEEAGQGARVPPPDEWRVPQRRGRYMRNNIVELIPDPMTPLFGTLGRRVINERLSGLIAEFLGGPGLAPAELIVAIEAYAYYSGAFTAGQIARILWRSPGITMRMMRGAIQRWREAHARYRSTVEQWQGQSWRASSATQILQAASTILASALDYYGTALSGVIPAAWISEGLFTLVYDRLIRRAGDPPASTFLLGLDSTPIRAEQALHDLSVWVRSDGGLASYIASTPATRLVAQLDADAPPGVDETCWREWQSRFDTYLQQYGAMVYDLDFAKPTPADEPTPVLEALKLFVAEQGSDPYARQRASVERRHQATEAVRRRLSGLRERLFLSTLERAQSYAPLREDALAAIGLGYPLLRQMLLEVGQRLVAAEVIDEAEEIFWLKEEEVTGVAQALEGGTPASSLVTAVAQRKRLWQARKEVSPPVMLPLPGAWLRKLLPATISGQLTEDAEAEAVVLRGTPCSPGRVTATARVLRGPQDFDQMRPGDVLVAGITTPAWTPLFALASAIVTDVGGPLSHGSIVAREYGIPAVLGTGGATRRLRSGKRVSVDGNSGTVTMVDSRVASGSL